MLARLRAANAGRPCGDWQRENCERWRRANPDARTVQTTDVVIEDDSEDAEPVEPVKRTRKRKPTLAGVARQAAKAGIEVAGYEVGPTARSCVVTGKPVGSDIDMDDTASPDPRVELRWPTSH